MSLPFGTTAFSVTGAGKNYEGQSVFRFDGSIRRSAKLIVAPNRVGEEDVTYTVTPEMPEFDTTGKLETLLFRGAPLPNWRPNIYSYVVSVDEEPRYDDEQKDFSFSAYDGKAVEVSELDLVKKQITFTVDGGATWTRISGQDGVEFFTDVTVDESSRLVHFTLHDGTVIDIPYVKDFEVTVDQDHLAVAYGLQESVNLTLKGVHTYQIVKPDGWRVSVGENTLTVTAPAAGNMYAEEEGEIAIIAVSVGGFSTIVKIQVRVLAPDLVFTLNPEPLKVTASIVPNNAISSCRVAKSISLSELSSADATAFLDADSQTFTVAGELVVPVSANLYGGTAYVIAEYTDLRGEKTLLQQQFQIQRAAVSVTQNSSESGTLSWHIVPNKWVSYYFQWVGNKDVITNYAGDPAADPDAFIQYLAARPSGTISTLWNKGTRDQSISNVDPQTKHTVTLIPVIEANSKMHSGLPVVLDLSQ